MSERQQIMTWMAALLSLVLLQFSAGADFSKGKPQDTPQRLSVSGPGAPSQTNEAGKVPASTSRSLWVTHGTRSSGTRKSIVAILDGLRVEPLVSSVIRRLQFESRPHSEFALVRITSARAPPASSFAR